MVGFLKVPAAAALGYLLITLIDPLLLEKGIVLNPYAIVGIYALMGLILIYLPARKRSCGRQPRLEYVANGQGQPTNRLFRMSDFEGYTLIDTDGTGRTFSDASGKIVCTCFVRSAQDTGGSSRLHLAALCLLCVAFGVLFEGLFRQSWWDMVPFALEHMWRNAEGILDAIGQIRPNPEIIDNLVQSVKELLSQLPFWPFQ